LEGLCAAMVPALRSIDDEIIDNIVVLADCDAMLNNLLPILQSGKVTFENQEVMEAIQAVQEKTASATVARAWLVSQVLHFRRVYTDISQHESLRRTEITHKSRTYQESYKTYLGCQGRIVDLTNRLAALVEMLAAIKDTTKGNTSALRAIDKPSLHLELSGLAVPRAGTRLPIETTSYVGPEVMESLLERGGIGGISATSAPNQHQYPITDEDESLTKRLEDAESELEYVRSELFQVIQSKDRTPGALLFFAALQDPSALESLQVMLGQLLQLKRVADCSEHMDFTTLRRRLLVCISNTPPLERLITRYSKMHSTWTQSRAKMFTVRNQVGGDSDTSYTCPLCCNDTRDINADPTALKKTGKGNGPDDKPAYEPASTKRRGAGGGPAPPPPRALLKSESELSLPELKAATKLKIQQKVKRGHW